MIIFSDVSHLHFLYGLHVHAALLAALHEGGVKGVHEDDPSQARRLFPLHVVQQHLGLLHLVADDRGDLSWKHTTGTQEHTHPCVIISRIRKIKEE